MNILKELNTNPLLTHNEKQLAAVIIENPGAFLAMKPKEIAETAFVSISTIYRLVDKLGFNGINALKQALTKELIAAHQVSPQEDLNYPFLPSDTQFEIARNLKTLYDHTLSETLHLLDPETLDQVVQCLVKAQRINVYASSANVHFAENFKFQMQEIGIAVDVPAEDYVQRLSATQCTDKDVAIVVSYGGRGITTRAVVDILVKNETPIILITSTQNNPLEPFATHCLYMSSFENHYDKISSYATRLSLIYIFDMIYTSYFMREAERHINYKKTTYQKMNRDLK